MKPLLMFSGDGHFSAEPEAYRSYLEPQYRSALDDLEAENARFAEVARTVRPVLPTEVMEVVDPDGIYDQGGLLGAWDVGKRLTELDREGIAGEIVFPGHQFCVPPFFSVVNNPFPPELRAAGQRAHHRWAADCFAESNGRIFGYAEPGPCLDLDETIRELRWCADHRFRSVQLPGNVSDTDLPPLTDSYYEPFWAACAEMGLTLAVHAGYGQEQGRFWDFADAFMKKTVGAEGNLNLSSNMMEQFEQDEESPLRLEMGPRRAIWQLMLGGVFDRHPDLKMVLTEVRADWVPPTLRRLDALADRAGSNLKLKPSEYWSRNCFVAPSSIHVCELEMRAEIGIDNIIFGTDYPHPEGTWPNTQDWNRIAFQGVPEVDARKIFSENAMRCFGIDPAPFEAIAARIGPRVEDILVDSHNIPQVRIEHFDHRGGITRPAEEVSIADIDGLFAEDLQRVASA